MRGLKLPQSFSKVCRAHVGGISPTFSCSADDALLFEQTSMKGIVGGLRGRGGLTSRL